MADYRQFCGFCGNEVGWGPHASGCEAQARVRKAEQELREWEKGLYETYKTKTEEELFDEVIAVSDDISALSTALAAATRKEQFIKRELFLKGFDWSKKVRDRLAGTDQPEPTEEEASRFGFTTVDRQVDAQSPERCPKCEAYLWIDQAHVCNL